MRGLVRYFLVILMISVVACTKDNSSSVDPSSGIKGTDLGDPTGGKKPGVENDAAGTSDVGGGTKGSSTAEEIKEAVENARKIIVDPRRHRYFNDMKFEGLRLYSDEEYDLRMEDFNLINAIIDPRGSYLTKNIIDDMCYEDFKEIPGCHPYDFEENKEILEHAETLPDSTYIANIEIEYVEDDYCPADDKDNADASVTYNDLNSSMCFSIFSLKNEPSHSIGKTVFGLFMHEISHMHGHPDKKAYELQDIMVGAYDYLNSDFKEPLASIFREKLLRIKSHQNGVLDSLEKLSRNAVVDSKSHPTTQYYWRDSLVGLSSSKAYAEEFLSFSESYPSSRTCTDKKDPDEIPFNDRLKMLIDSAEKIIEVLSQDSFKSEDFWNDELYNRYFNSLFRMRECQPKVSE